MSGMYPANGGKPIFHEFITPIGLFCHMYHDKPSLRTEGEGASARPILNAEGLQEAEFKVTMAWDKSRINELGEMITLAKQAQAEAWPHSVAPGAFFHLQPFFRDGDNPQHNTKGREYLFNKYYLNFKSKAKVEKSKETGMAVYSGAPGLLGPYGPEDKIMAMDVYGGCTGRISGIIFATQYMGKNYISTRLNNIQKFEDGDRIAGGKPDAASQFDAIKTGAPAANNGLSLGGGSIIM